MVRFATAHTDLAKHVRRLQLRVPCLISWFIKNSSGVVDGISLSSHWARLPEDHDRSTAGLGEIDKNSPLVRPSKHLWSYDTEEAAWRPWAIEETLESLPNLCHVENAISTHCGEYLAEMKTRPMNDDGGDVQETYEDYKLSAHLKGVKNIVAYVADTITSLKMGVVHNVLTDLPLNLQHLNLDFRIHMFFHDDRSPEHEQIAVEEWRSTLKDLTQLRSLRLAFACGGARTEEHTEKDSMMGPGPVYIDDLFIDPQNSVNVCFFPHLRSLNLVNCSLRVHGLQTIANRHSATLKEFELREVTFDPGYSVRSWSEVGAMCHEALPNLTYLRLAKLVTHSMIPVVQDAPLNLPVPVKWNRGLEGATSYEWIKDGRGSGADLETIGFDCPWTCEDVK